MERYEVTLRDMRTGNRRSIMFSADDFSHAEEQASDGYKAKTKQGTDYAYFDPKDEEIIKIEKEYAANESGDWPIPENLRKRT